MAGTLVFGDLLYKRFAYQFSGDVIEATFRSGENFLERASRLAEFRSLVKSSNEITSYTKFRYLLVTLPLVKLSAKNLRFFALVALRSGMLSVLSMFTFAGFAAYVRRYAVQKKAL